MFSDTEGTSPDAVVGLIQEAADSVRSDFNEESAVQWAQEYAFPPEYLASDFGHLRAAQLDFVSKVRRRLKILSPNRLNH